MTEIVTVILAALAGVSLVSLLAPLWVNLCYGALLSLLGRYSARFGTWYSSRRMRALGLAPSD